MLNWICALAVSAALSVTLAACATADDPRPASATDRSRSSCCQGDAPIGYAQADQAGQDDPGNTLDSEPTVAEIQTHNARYRAACQSEPETGASPRSE